WIYRLGNHAGGGQSPEAALQVQLHLTGGRLSRALPRKESTLTPAADHSGGGGGGPGEEVGEEVQPKEEGCQQQPQRSVQCQWGDERLEEGTHQCGGGQER